MKINPRSAVLTGAVLAVVAAPVALGAGENMPLDGGTRNPSTDASQNYTRETEVIANVGTYGTRQSNKSDNGGGAIYGCRSKPGGSAQKNEPCVRAVNLAQGSAFEFQSGGLLGGIITVGKGGDDKKPFTTNATGVASGLNADRVDGKNGDDLALKTDKVADSGRLDGRDSASYAATNDFLFAIVNENGSVVNKRGGGDVGADGPDSEDTFSVRFERDISDCSFTATPRGSDAEEVFISVNNDGDNRVTVDQAGADAPVGFHLQVIC